MQLILIERSDRIYTGKMSKPLWLIWLGEEMPLLSEIWQLYLRRFGINHWYRFAFATSALDEAQIEYAQAM